jgi:uncharacterized delta-60 repeat protein
MKRAILLIAALSFLSGVFAQNKGLDLSFGNSGIAATSVYTNKKFKTPTGLIIQPDGKILISGNFIARYETNGTPDSSFATNGFFLPPYTNINSSITPANARAITLLSDGKILMGGKWDSSCYYVTRLLPDGTIDSTFGQNGISRSNLLDVWNILVQSDGKILAVGNGCGSSGTPQDSVFIERFKSDGAYDTTFGKNGYANAYLGNYGGSITNEDLLPDGRIVMGGIGHDDSGNTKVIILRFLPDGKLDTTLGGTGRIFPFYAWYCHALAVLPTGKIVLSLSDLNFEDITRINTDGSLDTTFGEGGFISIDGLATLYLLPLQNGSILCGGQKNGDYGVARLHPNGKGLDSTFGQNGLISTDVTGYWQDRLMQLAFQPDGKIIGFGTGAYATGPAGTMLVRYNADAATGINFHNHYLLQALSVYPNPAQTYIHLSGVSLNQMVSVKIVAPDGRLIKYLDTPSLTLPVIGYVPGVYLISVVLKNGRVASCRLTITE